MAAGQPPSNPELLFGTVSVDVAAPIDVEVLIAEFLADPSRPSLELPQQCTVDQRKRAKKLAEQQYKEELRCESFGFGPERQLHLFKRCAGKPEVTADIGQQNDAEIKRETVSVKNGFIDDWTSHDASNESSEPIVFRSMPAPPLSKIDTTTDVRTSKSGVAAAAVDMDPLSPIYEHRVRKAPSDLSMSAFVDSSVSDLPELAPTPTHLSSPGGLQVRNTFIHFESDAPADERNVQSMPHGMFRQCLLAESAEKTGSVTEVVEVSPESPVYACEVYASEVGEPVVAELPAAFPMSAPTEPPSLSGLLGPGTVVLLEGLVRTPAFNGLTGVVQSLDMVTNRYDVLLYTVNGTQLAKLKSENLRLATLPPPHFAPSVEMDHHYRGGYHYDGAPCVPHAPVQAWQEHQNLLVHA